MRQLMLSLRIANRFLVSSPVQSALIALGIAVGITTQVFVGSIIFSLQENIISQTIGSSAHVSIQAAKRSDPVELTARIEKLIATTPEVKQSSVSSVRYSTALYTDSADTSSLSLIGGTAHDLNGIYKLEQQIIGGASGYRSLRSNEIYIGKEFAQDQNIAVGESISLRVSTGGSLSFTVRGIYDIGVASFNERTAFVSSETVRSLLGWRPNQYSQINVQLNDPFQSAHVAEVWRPQLAGLKVTEWQTQNADLLVALTSQSASSYLIQGFVLVAVALGIASTLAIAAVQKTRQIGILKAMGMTDSGAGQIFLFQALGLGLTGATLGVVLSYLSLLGFGLIPVPFTIEAKPWFVAMSWLIGVLVAVVSSYIPIRNTGRLDPIEVIQNG